MSRIFICLTAALFAVALAACDGSDDGPVTFGGVAVEPVGGATLRATDSTLVVSGLPASGDGGFAVPGASQRLDAAITPVALPAGARFGTRVEAADGAEIASMFATGVGQDRVRFVFSFGAAAGVQAVRLRYLLGGRVLFEVPRLPVAVGRAGAAGRSATVLAAESAGEGGGKAGSAHAVRDGGRWVVVSDNEGSRPAGNRPAARGPGVCDVLTVLPPSVANVAPPAAPLCVDRIEVVPLTGTAPAAARVVVASQGLSGFTVRSLGAQ